MKYFAYCRKSTEGDDRQALSIPAQIDEIKRAFSSMAEIEIVEWLEEKRSAKAPGRPVYASMIKRLEAGEADGIVAWHPDRLARNSVDGGWIVHLLDQNVIKDLKFVSYTFEKSPQGMFMLQIMFGQSKYYVDALSVNVKRGMRKKAEMGWLPNLAPLGYRNDKETNTITTDPERFPLMRRMWEMLLAGQSVAKINDVANTEWGFRTPVRKRSGGRPLSLSATYRMFTNPFYAGIISGYGGWKEGKHQAMVTMAEFNQAGQLLQKPDAPRPIANNFAYTGLVRCACGLAITAEEKVKPSGRRYVYYRCTRRARPRCHEPAVRAEVLDQAISDFLKSLTLCGPAEHVLPRVIEEGKREVQLLRDQKKASLDRAVDHNRQESRTLTDLRLRNLIDDTEFVERRRLLQRSLVELERADAETEENDALWLELAQAVISFRKYAPDWFLRGSNDDKRLVLNTVGSNSVLANGKLSIQARFPFQKFVDPAYFPNWRAIVEDVRTPNESPEAARQVIACVRTLATRSQARHRGVALSSLLPSMPRTAPRGRASWRVTHKPRPRSDRYPAPRGKAA